MLFLYLSIVDKEQSKRSINGRYNCKRTANVRKN